MPMFDLLQKLWENLNLRGMIVLSLSLQVFLVIFAPIRKSASNMIIVLTWSAYLVADWAADFAFGLLTRGQKRDSQGPAADAYTDLMAFWAPFLLVHLGGPDTITAFALEDNELWRRHLLNLLFQLGAAGYLFYHSLPVNKLKFPTILIFIHGLIKYIERTRALFIASFSKFRDSMLKPDAGPNYAMLMVEYYSMIEAGIPATINIVPEPRDEHTEPSFVNNSVGKMDDISVICMAYRYFTTFRGLLVDMIYSFRLRKQSIDIFNSIKAEDAFKVIEVELNFIYDAFYTKAAVIHCRKGYFFRAISFISALTALALFRFLPKHDLHEYDIVITYTLLIGAVGLDTAALIMLVFSNWTIATIDLSDKNDACSPIKKIFVKLFRMFKSEDSTFAKSIFCCRWSRRVSGYNLLDQCLKKHRKLVDDVIRWLHVDALLEDLKSGNGAPFTGQLRDLIFEEVKKKAAQANDLEEIKKMCAKRGEDVLEQNDDYKELLPFVRKVDYGESILLWHIATDLCYNDEADDRKTRTVIARENSKILSEYMLYLLIKQPDMMSTVSGIGQTRFRDTCEEAKKFFNQMLPSESRDKCPACFELLSIPTVVNPDAKGDRSKSVLFDACILAKELTKFRERKWEIMSKVWVELLAYAASHCRPYYHAQQLSKGGELVSFVWLLMVQFGLSEQFQIITEHASTQLIVDK